MWKVKQINYCLPYELILNKQRVRDLLTFFSVDYRWYIFCYFFFALGDRKLTCLAGDLMTKCAQLNHVPRLHLEDQCPLLMRLPLFPRIVFCQQQSQCLFTRTSVQQIHQASIQFYSLFISFQSVLIYHSFKTHVWLNLSNDSLSLPSVQTSLLGCITFAALRHVEWKIQ